VSGFLASFESFLLEWAGVSDVVSGSRGAFIDARHLAFLEALYGDQYRANPTGAPDPGPGAAPELEAHFAELVETFAIRYMAQSSISAAALGQAGNIAEHPLLFLSPLTLGSSPNDICLSGSAELALIMSVDAVGSGRISMNDVATVLTLLHRDLGYTGAAALGGAAD
jgi:hypothetical protein